MIAHRRSFSDHRFPGFRRELRMRWGGATAVAALVLTLCAGCRTGGGPGRILEPKTQDVSKGHLVVSINDTLCTVLAGSWPVAQLTPGGESAAFSVGGLLANPSGQLVGQLFLTRFGEIAPGTYELSSVTANSAGGRSGSDGFLFLESRETAWSTDGTHLGTLTITIVDIAGRHVEGRFSFDGANASTGVVRQFRNGSFSCPLTIIE